MQIFCESHWSSVGDADSLAIGQLVLIDTEQNDVRWRRGQVTRISRSVGKAVVLQWFAEHTVW